jgi:hypothetical protein
VSRGACAVGGLLLLQGVLLALVLLAAVVGTPASSVARTVTGRGTAPMQVAHSPVGPVGLRQQQQQQWDQRGYGSSSSSRQQLVVSGQLNKALQPACCCHLAVS